MSTVHGGQGRIITNGLVLNLDAANPRSFLPPPFNTDTWVDLSGNNNNGTLINGPAYNSANGGSIVFDGTNDYGRITYNSNFNLSNTDYTFEVWGNVANFSSGNIFLSKDTYGANFDWCLQAQTSTIIRFLTAGASVSITATVPAMSINRWYHFVMTNISNVLRIYLNGTLYRTQAVTTTNASQSFVTIGCAGWNLPNSFTNGKISIARIYRKGLTDSEILQNFNATRARFGV